MPDSFVPVGNLIILRTSQLLYRNRRFGFFVNGEKVAELRDGETRSLVLAEGTYRVYGKFDWNRTDELVLDVSNDNVVRLELGNTLRGWRLFLHLVFGTFFYDGTPTVFYLRKCD